MSDPKRQLWTRATLVAAILLALIGLWAVVKASPLMRDDPPAAEPDPAVLPKDTKRHVRVRGTDDEIVPGTVVDVLRDPSKPVDVSWHPDQGVLVLPEEGGEFRLRVIMPGHRLTHFQAVRGGQFIRMRPGYVVKVPLRGVPETGLPKNVRFLLRVQPEGTVIDGLSPQEVVDLMDNRGGPGSGPDHIPRGQFGYPISREQAEAGVVLPAPGTYHVRWGLVDVVHKTWRGLDDSTGRTFTVEDRDDAQSAPLDVTLDKLQATLDRLAESVEDAKKHRDKLQVPKAGSGR